MISSVIAKRATLHAVTRLASGSYDAAGVYTASSSDPEQVRVYTQPASGRVLESLPEGDRSREARVGWTLDSMGVNDRVLIGSSDFVVREVRDWEEFRWFLCVRAGDGA